jgi:nickel transport protein
VVIVRLANWMLIGLMLLLVPSAVRAHAVGAECRVEGNRVVIEAYFDDDTPAQAALIKVFDRSDMLVAQGKADSKGIFSCTRPPEGQYRVVVDAGAGHRTEVEMQVPAPPQPDEIPREVISEGARRAEFTQYPWLKVSVGLGFIGLFSFAFWAARRRKLGD